MISDLIPVIGLFGTCGDSKWRDEAIKSIEGAGLQFFNPVVADWTEECMKNEVENAQKDAVIMLVVTGETTGIASMAESGWIALNSYVRNQKLVIFLEDVPKELDGDLRINKTRKLLKNYIEGFKDKNVFLADSVHDATSKAIQLMQSFMVQA